MSFLQPIFLVGLLAAALPLLVHLINRRKATRRPFPALAFLLESNKRVARSIKVRQWALLALRMLAVALLAMALAKPFMLSTSGVSASERLPTAVTLVVDTSASMSHGEWWERAQDAMDEELGRLRPWDEVALVTTTQRELPKRLTDSHGKVKSAARALTPVAQRGDLMRALGAASEVLATSQLPNRKIVLITDLSADALSSQTATSPPPYPVELRLVRGEAQETPTNLAVTHVAYEQEAGEENLWRIDATLRNDSTQAMEQINVHLSFDGERASTGRIERLEPGEEVVHPFRHRQEQPGVVHASISLDAQDGYAFDDTRHFVFRTRAKIPALLVNGEAAGIIYDDELFFLSRALNPSRDMDTGIVPTIISPEGLASRRLGEHDVIVLANVPRIPSALATHLERFVREGGGLLIAAGDQVDVEAYNQTLASVLPKPLRSLKELARRDDPDAPVKVTHLGATHHKHPIFRAFNDMGGAALQSAQVYSYMLLEPGISTQSETLLSYKDNAPALIERRIGRGRVLLWTTTLDFEWTDLPIRSAYLPLMQRAVQYLARRATSTGRVEHEVGEPVKLDISGMFEERVIVRGPWGPEEPAQREVFEPGEQQEEISFSPQAPGIYEVFSDDDTQAARGLPDLTFAVNVDAAESRLGGLERERFEQWLESSDEASAKQVGAAKNPGAERRVNIWPSLLFLVTLLLLAETILGTRRSVLVRLWRLLTGQRASA